MRKKKITYKKFNHLIIPVSIVSMFILNILLLSIIPRFFGDMLNQDQQTLIRVFLENFIITFAFSYIVWLTLWRIINKRMRFDSFFNESYEKLFAFIIDMIGIIGIIASIYLGIVTPNENTISALFKLNNYIISLVSLSGSYILIYIFRQISKNI